MVKPFRYAIALTGGIATGKSTVVSFLKSWGYEIIDADSIAHEILDAQYLEVAKLFGQEFIQDKKVKRPALGKIIFGNEQNKKALESLLHPLIFAKIKRLSNIEEKKQKYYFIDIPLFFETSRYEIAKVLLIYTAPKIQLQRLMARNDFSKEDAKLRIQSQIPIDEKVAKSTYLIDNSATLTDLENTIRNVLKDIEKDFK